MSKQNKIPVSDIGKYQKSTIDLWNAMYSENYEGRQHLIGQILTIIDAAIVDKEQNKSVKDLIKTMIWEDLDRQSRRIAEWMQWLDDNYKTEDSEQDSPKPYRYDGDGRNPSLNNYQ